MTEAIIWLVIWGIFALGGSGLVGWAVFGLSVLLAAATDKEWIALAGAIGAWLTGVSLFVISCINVIIQIVTIIQLL